MKKLNDVLNGVMNDILSEGEDGTGVISNFFNRNRAAGLMPFGSTPGGDGNPEAETGGMSAGVPTTPYGAEPGLTDRLAQMWAGLSDNEKMAIIGGAGGTALAAGAGALYLRKKQRDANRAMGR